MSDPPGRFLRWLIWGCSNQSYFGPLWPSLALFGKEHLKGSAHPLSLKSPWRQSIASLSLVYGTIALLPKSRGGSVTTKERVQEVLDRLPDDCSLDEVLYNLYVLQTVDRGLADAEAGRTISHEQVADELRQKWVLGAAR